MELDLAEFGKRVDTATTSENPDRFVGPKVLLKRGDIGPDVAALQQYLVDGANPVGANPVGANPVGANPVGAVTPEVIDRSNDVFVTDADTAYSQGDSDVGPNGYIRFAQETMIRLGIEGVGEVDGVYGRNTAKGIQDFQKRFGLPRTGVLDQATQDAFNNLTDDQIASFASDPNARTDKLDDRGRPIQSIRPEPRSESEVFAKMQQEKERQTEQANTGQVDNEGEAQDTRRDGELDIDYTMPITALTGTEFKAIQSGLNALGFDVGKVDGSFGPKSKEQMKKFQASLGLDQTGTMNQATYEAMSEQLAGIEVTQDGGADFYRAPKLKTKSDTKTPTATGSWVPKQDAIPKKSWTTIDGKQMTPEEFSGTVNTYKVGGEESQIIDLTDAVKKTKYFTTGKGKGKKPKTVKRVVFHSTAAIYGKKGVGGFMDAREEHPTAHFFIDREGKIYKLFDPAVQGAHIGGMNSGSVGIEIEGFPEGHYETGKGSFDEADWVTDEQNDAAAWLGEFLMNEYPSIEHVMSHRELGHGGGKGKVDGWNALRKFRSRMGQSEYGMLKSGRNNADSSTAFFTGDRSVFETGGNYFGQGIEAGEGEGGERP